MKSLSVEARYMVHNIISIRNDASLDNRIVKGVYNSPLYREVMVMEGKRIRNASEEPYSSITRPFNSSTWGQPSNKDWEDKRRCHRPPMPSYLYNPKSFT